MMHTIIASTRTVAQQRRALARGATEGAGVRGESPADPAPVEEPVDARVVGVQRDVGAHAGLWTLIGVTVLAAFVLLVPPGDPVTVAGIPFSAPFSAAGPLGTDQVGRDLLVRILVGGGASWMASVIVVAVVAAFGTLVGLFAGFAGGRTDATLSALVNFFLAVPGSVLAIVIAAILGPSLPNAMLAIAVVAWPYYARLVRSEVRAIAARPHVEAARVAGASSWSIMTRHVLPGAWPVVVVTATLDLGGVIILLSGLSFLGLGMAPPAPELGAMVAQGLPYLLTNGWISIVPAVAILVLALVANLAGDSIRRLFRHQ